MTLLKNSSPVSTTLVKPSLTGVNDPATVGSDFALSMTEPVGYRTYQIPNLTDTEPVRYRTFQIPNLSDADPVRYRNYQILNL